MAEGGDESSEGVARQSSTGFHVRLAFKLVPAGDNVVSLLPCNCPACMVEEDMDDEDDPMVELESQVTWGAEGVIVLWQKADDGD